MEAAAGGDVKVGEGRVGRDDEVLVGRKGASRVGIARLRYLRSVRVRILGASLAP